MIRKPTQGLNPESHEPWVHNVLDLVTGPTRTCGISKPRSQNLAMKKVPGPTNDQATGAQAQTSAMLTEDQLAGVVAVFGAY